MIEEEKIDENELEEDKFIQKIEKLSDIQDEHKYLFRVCLLGDAGVGKTSLLTRFCDNYFFENYNNTIGIDFRVATLKYDNIISKIHIWDTAGQERFRSLSLNYINNSHGFIFIYDITSSVSFENVEKWISSALQKNNHTVANFLVGNKSDLEQERKVSKSKAEDFAKKNKLFFLETSAKNHINVEKLFYYFLYKMVEFYKTNEYIEDANMKLTTEKTEEIPTERESEKSCFC